MINYHEISLSLFFLYFVITSGESYKLINCKLQKYITKSIFFKHFQLFFSIYIFTFILNWYTYDSLYIGIDNTEIDIEKKINKKILKNKKIEINKEKNFKKKIEYLITSFLYTIIIYIIFLLSTKTEGYYLLIFFIGIIIILALTILQKMIDYHLGKFLCHKFLVFNKDISKLKKKYKKENHNKILLISLIQNTSFFIFIFIFVVLVYGSYKYYLKQFKDYNKNWSWIKFWFGTNTCKSLT